MVFYCSKKFAKELDLATIKRINDMSGKKLDLGTLEYIKLVIEVTDDNYNVSPVYVRINQIRGECYYR